MGNEYGMKIWMELAVKNAKEIQKEIQERFKNIDLEGIMSKTKAAKDVQGKLGGFAEAAGMGKNIGKIAATAAATLTVLYALKKVSDRIFSKLVESSPYLQGIMNVMRQAWLRVWRPFGDFLASLLRPLAVQLLRLTSKWLQFTRTPAGEKTVSGISGATAGGIAGAGIGAVAGGVMGGPLGALAGAGIGGGIGAALGGFIGVISKIDWSSLGDSISEWAKSIQGKIKEAWRKFVAWTEKTLSDLPGKIGDAWNKFTNWLGAKLPEWSEDLGRKLGEGIRKIGEKIAAYPDWLWNKLVSIWTWTKDFPDWLWKKLQSIWVWTYNFGKWLYGKLKSIWNWTYNFNSWLYGKLKKIWVWKYDFGSWLWKKIKKSLTGFSGGFWGGLTGNQKGLNFVPETGIYKLHRGEQVVTAGRTGQNQNNLSYNPTFVIQGAPSLAGESSVRSQIRSAARMLEFEMRRRQLL